MDSSMTFGQKLTAILKKFIGLFALKPEHIPMAVFSFFVLLSFVTGSRRELSAFGEAGRSNGAVPLLLATLGLFLLTSLVRSRGLAKALIFALCAVSGIVLAAALAVKLGAGFMPESLSAFLDAAFTGEGRKFCRPWKVSCFPGKRST